VRMAAHEIWNHAQASTPAILGDDCDVGDVMEVCVEAVSQYLDRRRIQPFSINIAGLLYAPQIFDALRTESICFLPCRRAAIHLSDHTDSASNHVDEGGVY
jgi:hypothetical protein